MIAKKRATRKNWIDPDDAPVLTDAFFEHADEYRGDKLVKHGWPPKDAPKVAVKLRSTPICWPC